MKCSRCERSLGRNSFYKTRDGECIKICKECTSVKYYAKVGRDKPPAKEKKGYVRTNRRYKYYGTKGSHTYSQAHDLLENQKFACANPYCKTTLTEANRALDHKLPISKGGSNYISNLHWLCRTCNGKKYTKSWEEFMAAQWGLSC